MTKVEKELFMWADKMFRESNLALRRTKSEHLSISECNRVLRNNNRKVNKIIEILER